MRVIILAVVVVTLEMKSLKGVRRAAATERLGESILKLWGRLKKRNP